MRWAIVLMSVAACNAVFGIRDTKQTDAAYFDAPVDAPFACPGFGSALEMSGQLHQEFQQECLDYHVSATGLAAGMCYAGRDGASATGYVLAIGTIGGGPLVATAGLPDYYKTYQQPTAFDQYSYLFPSPDGTHVYSQMQHYDYTSMTTTYVTNRFTKQADSSWLLTDTLPIGSFGMDSTVFHGPTGDRFLHMDAQTGTIVEWSEDGAGGWTAGSSHLVTEMGVTGVGVLSLTSDGLRMTFQGTMTGELSQRPLYTDRADVSSWFRPAVPLVGAPYDSAIQLTDDCARLYTTGLGAVFSMQQR
jgi:hypothetical protein